MVFPPPRSQFEVDICKKNCMSKNDLLSQCRTEVSKVDNIRQKLHAGLKSSCVILNYQTIDPYATKIELESIGDKIATVKANRSLEILDH